MTQRPDNEDELIDSLLGAPRTMRRADLLREAGVTGNQSQQFWLALGFPVSQEGEVVYTQADLDALLTVETILEKELLDVPLALSMTRGVGRTVERLVSWQVSIALEMVLEADGLKQSAPVDDLASRLSAAGEPYNVERGRRPTAETADRVGRLLLELGDELAPLLVYTWRRHLASTIGRLRTEALDDDETDSRGVVRSVGFADMVGFTSLVNHLSERQLAALVLGFEALAADVVVAHGGTIIKTLGDEVVYVADQPAPAAEIALALIEGMDRDPTMPQLRIGLSTGGVLSHLGDIFGTTVNRASRLSNLARPDTVVIDDETSAALDDAPGMMTSRMEPRVLRGLGLTSVWQLRRATGHEDRGPRLS